MNVIVTRHGPQEALLDWGKGARRAAVGHGGIGVKQAEGDGITPLGTYPLRRLLYRADRLTVPATGLPRSALTPEDGWCDASNDPRYNQPVRRRYPASSEALWRTDHLYDLLVVIGFNEHPVVPGKGSAIFLHVARPTYSPTAGCVAIAESDLLELLTQMRIGDTITIRV